MRHSLESTEYVDHFAEDRIILMFWKLHREEIFHEVKNPLDTSEAAETWREYAQFETYRSTTSIILYAEASGSTIGEHINGVYLRIHFKFTLAVSIFTSMNIP